MTDRELLELAAKAAKIEIHRWLPDGRPQLRCDTHQLGPIWNPLDDDGDALRLAVKLGLAVSVEYQFGSTSVLWGPPTGHVREDHADDPYAATRRAIVRAAAELGRNA